jgi:FkbM family methyltransferase
MSMPMHNGSSFLDEYNRMIFDSVGNNYRDNFDTRRFGRKRAGKVTARGLAARAAKRLLAGAGLARAKSVFPLIKNGMSFVQPHVTEMEWLYDHLADEESRALLVQLFAYRALGHRRVKLPLSKREYWQEIEAIEKSAAGCETIDAGFLGMKLSRMNLQSIGYPIELFFVPFAIITQFIKEPYRCKTSDGIIEAEDGDVVVDAGGCWADTALYFAAKVGRRGKVASFEFLPDNLEIFQRNVELNPELKPLIKLFEYPLWSLADEKLFISGHGPGTKVGSTADSADAKEIRTISIDHVVETGEVDRVNFIKMDIEGAELPALKGAEATLKRFRPKLAISVYHSLSDFWEIPQYLDSLNLGYKFYLRHFTIHAEESVLFAHAD